MKRPLLLLLLLLSLVAVLVPLRSHFWTVPPSLPYTDSFARNTASEWTPYSGLWQIREGAIVNRSDEDGAKLITGNPKWSDYEVNTDIRLVGLAGNAGVVVRVNGEELGADAYNGYYVGLRIDDSALVVGRADHGWLGGRPATVRGGVWQGTWYHLRVVIVGCTLAAQVTNLTSGATSSLTFEEPHCVTQGRVGLRSMGMGGEWKNFRVAAANSAQLHEIADHADVVTHPVYPLREDQYDRVMQQLAAAASLYSKPGPGPDARPVIGSGSTSIASGRAAATPQEHLTFRGLITLASPVYMQDDTGGVELRDLRDSDSNVGDEVEVQGQVIPTAVAPYVHVLSLRVISERTPVAPIAITGTQAADGSYDGRLVQLDGTLLSRSLDNEVIRLRLTDGNQTFQAVGRGLLSSGGIRDLTLGSQLRLRGICTLGATQQGGNDAYTILLRSMDDVDVLGGPPWYTPHVFFRYILASLAVLGLGLGLYLRAERNKMHAILEERARLAHEMHDTLAQSFAGVGFQLQGVRNSLRSGALPLPAVLEKLDAACKMVSQTHRETSAEIAGLHPGSEEDVADLLSALASTTHAMVEEHLPPITLKREGTPRGLSLAVRDAMFQVGRESIANILRHSSATEIVLHLRYEPRYITLQVIDNGCGFRYDEHASGFGIRGMRRRVERVGGTLSILTAQGQGTEVKVVARYGMRFGFGSLPARLHSPRKAKRESMEAPTRL